MTWNIQDTNLSWYVPKANVDHTKNDQGTAVSTLDHSATTPSVHLYVTDGNAKGVHSLWH